MTLTGRSMGWLDQNRHRAYPMDRDEWRERVSPESGLDCVLLDATVFDACSPGIERLRMLSVEVSSGSGSGPGSQEGHAKITMEYAGKPFEVEFSGGDSSGPGSFFVYRGWVPGGGDRPASVSLVFSSYRHMFGIVGKGKWEIGCSALRSRVANLCGGAGVDFVSAGGSEGVEGHDVPSVVSGDVLLEDGYRTSPIIWNGKVFVRVGRRYGHDPCSAGFGSSGSPDCGSPLFFFCGQNAINGGNVVIKGGRGISVAGGRGYKVRSGTCSGKTIPCVEIVAGRELSGIAKPGA